MTTIAIILLTLVGASPDTKANLWKPGRAHPSSPLVDPGIGPGGLPHLAGIDKSLRHYTYVFDGIATSGGLRCPNVNVVLHVTTSKTSRVLNAKTNEEGKYSIEVAFDGSRYEPVNWSMEAYSTKSRPVEFEGRHILMREDETVVVNNPVDFGTIN